MEPGLAVDVEYRCPGETHAIDRTLHLARLASFYHACRACPHREDTAGLVGAQARRVLEVQRSQPRAELFQAEGLAGVYHNHLTTTHARRFAAAFGVAVRRAVIDDGSPRVV